MIALPKKSWLSGVRTRLSIGGSTPRTDSEPVGFNSRQTLGIFSFEVAKTMSRLISLHQSLTEPELSKLRNTYMLSEGVAYLNSADRLFLLRVASADLVEDLDHAAGSISRIGDRFGLRWPRNFDDIYSSMKEGSGDDLVLGFSRKDIEKNVKKMEAFVSATSALHEEMETLAELEASERNLERWRNYSGPMTPGGKAPAVQPDPPGADLLMKKLAAQRRLIRKLQVDSLWAKNYDKIADLMIRMVVSLFARICSIFSPVVTDLPNVAFEREGQYRFVVNRRNQSNPNFNFFSGPLERMTPSKAFFRNSGPIGNFDLMTKEIKSGTWTVQFLEPKVGTVGELGLALRYADVVELAETMLFSPDSAGKDARKELYEMLPRGMRRAVRAKLRSTIRVGGPTEDDERMAEGWKEAAGRILKWLGPMAHDTVQWHSERNCEKQRLEPTPKVLLLRTLHLADRVKAEAAIVEVLVGLSCVYRYQHGLLGASLEESDSD